MINNHEIEIARHCITYAMEQGASAARVSLSKGSMDACTLLNGELDKVTHSADRSIYLYLFVDGRYGTFSTNRLEKEEVEEFIRNAVEMVRMLGQDECRRLPDAERTATDAATGLELDLYDCRFEESTSESRLDNARRLSIYDEIVSSSHENDYILISEECEYSESMDDNYVIDSQGFEGRHTESSYSCFCEMTIEDTEGCKYSGYWWEATPKSDRMVVENCSRKALERAVRQIGPKPRRGGRYRMVVDSTVATRLISPLFTALNASSIQQKMSFLEDSAGKKVFPEGFTIMDMARTPGKAGSRLFDTEGVATADSPVIENGVVKRYFVNTYMSHKMGIEPTVEDISRPCVMPYLKDEALPLEEKDLSLKDILQRASNGILVTGFNGGNCNPVTGDFSYGIEGFAFSRGRITHPVREMLITGNMMELWNSLSAVGNDALGSARWQVGTLAFENVSFSA
ncbi:MAG: TldD/PmbA family protein [Bacteroidales bacterium]|nr:TldD/PmbA family protein [Bacteroidales bacterium]